MLPPLIAGKYVSLIWCAFYASAVVLGAPLLSEFTGTSVLATVLVCLTVLPAVLLVQSEERLITLVAFFPEVDLTKTETLLLSTAIFSLVGAWAGAFVYPLDWDRWWQRYPLPSLFGSAVGWVIGFILGFVKIFFGRFGHYNIDDVPKLLGIFLAEFDNTSGPILKYQVPDKCISNTAFQQNSQLIIPKPQLFLRSVKVSLKNEQCKILGYPVGLDHKKYGRGRYTFNMCFVVEWDSVADTMYEPIVQKCAEYMIELEQEYWFLTDPQYKDDVVRVINKMYENMNAKGESVIELLIDEQMMTLYFKLCPSYRGIEPPDVSIYMVPMFIRDIELTDRLVEKMDVLSQKIIPMIDGIKTVKEIANIKALDPYLVARCVRMVFLVIRLVGEKEDRLFENIIVDTQISRLELLKRIEGVTQIPIEYQQIEFRSEKLPGSLHPLESINDFEELVVKHALLGTWSEYLEYCGNVNDTKKTRSERTKLAHQAIAYSKVLEDSGFLTVYVTFSVQWRDTIGRMMRFVDRTQNALKSSATTFFSKMYPNSQISFKPKQGGTRAGIVVAVTCHDEEAKYYMKTYHHAGSSISLQNTAKRHLPDLREMFAYRLLELIGVGPIVFFPFYAGSTYIHYIATKEVEEFKELDTLEDVSLQNKVVVEAYLLSLILGIRDLNEGNIGSTKEKALSIIDFYVPDTDNFVRRTILEDFKDKSNFGGLGKANEILTEIGHEERMKIAKDALPHWSRINSMTSDIIGSEKSELREHGIKFGTATNDVEKYLHDIKANYALICLDIH